jgi:small subunit ribosomal protein S7
MRRHSADIRPVKKDAKYGSELVTRMVNRVMRKGKKSIAEGIVYGALEQLAEATSEDPVEVMTRAVENVKPRVEVKSRRVGGATYQVPIEVSKDRQFAMALRWIIQFAIGRSGVPMRRALAVEILDAYRNEGSAVRRRDETHKMAQANRAFAHYRW